MTARTAGSRVLHAIAFAPRTGLPVRYWRLIWLTIPLRLLVAFPLACVLFIPHAVAQLVVWLTDQFGGLLGNLYVRMYNADLERSGWTGAPARLPAPELNPEWLERSEEGSPS